MPYIPPEIVAKAKQMDLYTYLKTYEPQELVHFGGSTYCTREHDSLKISNGKWYWFSRSIGGRSALDYLIKVKGIPFTEAVEVIVGRGAIPPPTAPCTPKANKVKSLCLPEASRCATHAMNYLAGRGIDCDLLDFCLSTGRLYESQKYHNVVFVGQDKYGKPRYANLRGIGTDFKRNAFASAFCRQPGYVMEAYSSKKTKTPGRKNFLLNVSNGDKLGYEISDSVRIRKSFLLS